MRNMRYTQYMQEIQKKREARSLSTQEIIALALVIAAFAYIIFGLINRDDTDSYEMEGTAPVSESYPIPNIGEGYNTHYEMYYEAP